MRAIMSLIQLMRRMSPLIVVAATIGSAHA
ncbi:2-oxoglutarate dehydrogenase, partial [Burkholderia multivorans]